MKSSFEESTKIHSASELDEMVRRAKSEPAVEFEDDEHTMIGNSEELAARSMSVPDAPPAPRASSNIIRRTGAVRATSEPSPVASQADVIELEPDDDAFAQWDDAGQRTSPQSPDQLLAALKGVTPATVTNPETPARVEVTPRVAPQAVEAKIKGGQTPAVEASLRSPLVMMPPSVEVTKGTTLRVDRIVGIVAIALLIGVIVLAYRRISSLEDELAATKAALDAATDRSPSR